MGAGTLRPATVDHRRAVFRPPAEASSSATGEVWVAALEQAPARPAICGGSARPYLPARSLRSAWALCVICLHYKHNNRLMSSRYVKKVFLATDYGLPSLEYHPPR